MSKKIVILNGSPRRKGNTSMLVQAFTEGAESAGNTVTEFFLDSMDIHGCKVLWRTQQQSMSVCAKGRYGSDLSGSKRM